MMITMDYNLFMMIIRCVFTVKYRIDMVKEGLFNASSLKPHWNFSLLQIDQINQQSRVSLIDTFQSRCSLKKKKN